MSGGRVPAEALTLAWLALLPGAPQTVPPAADIDGYLAPQLGTIPVLGILVTAGAAMLARRLAI